MSCADDVLFIPLLAMRELSLFYVFRIFLRFFCLHRRVYQLNSDAEIKFAAVESKETANNCDKCGEHTTEMHQHESAMALIVCDWVTTFISICEENDMLEDLNDYLRQKESDSESETESLCETDSPSETESDTDSDSEPSKP